MTFPDDWDIRYQSIAHLPALTAREVSSKLDNPIGTERLEQLAQGKKSVCIVIDDISRPTKCDFLLPIVIEKLTRSGVGYENIKVVVALGGHRPLTKHELQIKVGKWVLERVQVLNHSPFAEDLVVVQDEAQIIKINKAYMDAQLRIAIGCIVPHTLAGFSGGAKSVIPGICGIETLHANHTLVFADRERNMAYKTSTCDPDNPMRANMERNVGLVGLDFIVNVVLNDEMDVADVYAGDFIKAHRAGCDNAKNWLKTKLVLGADIIILSAYPKDTEYSQLGTCFAVLGKHKDICVKKGGTIIAMTAASEGAGFHSLFGPGMRLFAPHDDNIPPAELKGIETIIFSDGVTEVDIRQFYRQAPPPIYGDWSMILRRLCEKYVGRKPLVAIYPMGSMQIGEI